MNDQDPEDDPQRDHECASLPTVQARPVALHATGAFGISPCRRPVVRTRVGYDAARSVRSSRSATRWLTTWDEPPGAIVTP